MNILAGLFSDDKFVVSTAEDISDLAIVMQIEDALGNTEAAAALYAEFSALMEATRAQ